VVDNIDKLLGVSINDNYIFFWNAGNAWKLDLKTRIKTKMSFEISQKEENTFIKRIRTTSDNSFICIRL